jgi:hypothetical protein
MTDPAQLHLRELVEPSGLPYRLGRHVEHDPRSREHDVARRLGGVRGIGSVEHLRVSPIFDQGSLGSCTGQAFAGWLGCTPHCTNATTFGPSEALWLYCGGTRADAFAGFYPPDDTGSTANAVAKVARSLGMIRSWSWAFTTATMLAALQNAPVLLGTVWTEDMFTPDRGGRVHPTGGEVGGHEYLCRGYDAERYELICDNSWGYGWGVDGSFRIGLDDWDNVLRPLDADVLMPHV